MLDQKKNKGIPRTYIGNVAVRWGYFQIDFSQKMLIENDELERYELKAGDIVICEGGEPGRCAVWKGDSQMFIQKALHRVRVKEHIADYSFVYYSFCNMIKQGRVEPYFTGSTIKHLPRERLISLRIPLPSLPTQIKIASILSSFDDKIAINRKICSNLEAQAQALFKHWFVDFAPFKDGKFVESELGLIPEGWRVGRLSELIEVKYGKDHKKLLDGDIPVYGSGGLMRKVNKLLYEGESVLIPRKGTLNNVMYVNEAFWTVDTMFYSVPKLPNIVLFTYILLSKMHIRNLVATIVYITDYL